MEGRAGYMLVSIVDAMSRPVIAASYCIPSRYSRIHDASSSRRIGYLRDLVFVSTTSNAILATTTLWWTFSSVFWDGSFVGEVFGVRWVALSSPQLTFAFQAYTIFPYQCSCAYCFAADLARTSRLLKATYVLVE